jgi:hypothetical protein
MIKRDLNQPVTSASRESALGTVADMQSKLSQLPAFRGAAKSMIEDGQRDRIAVDGASQPHPRAARAPSQPIVRDTLENAGRR